MKRLLPYIMVLGATTISTAIMAVVFVVLRPAASDTVVPAGVPAVKASAGVMYGPTLQELIAADSVGAAFTPPAEGDSTSVVQLALQDERRKSALLAEQLRAVMDSSQKASAAADSTQREQRKSMAKVLENMDPTSAARILNDFPDGDVKTCLLTMKKRQAAKILAALQPDRAARIMR